MPKGKGQGSKVSKKSLDNLIPAKKGEPSRNPLGVSKERVKLRLEAEEFFAKGGITDYLKRLHEFAIGKDSKLALEAIKEILDRTLGKNYTVDIGKETLEGITFTIKVVKTDG